MAVSSENKWLDGLREYMGICPLYEGVMLERDSDGPKVPIRFMRQMSQKSYRCKYCNVNREGQHQDYCPKNLPNNPQPRNAAMLHKGNWPQGNQGSSVKQYLED